MAATANNNPSSSSSSSSLSISYSSSAATATVSPRSIGVTRTGSPPWTQIVRGQESDTSTGAPTSPSSAVGGDRNCSEITGENSENGGGNVGGGGGKKVAWNKKPSNGPVENGGPGPVVMGPAEAWPALSESTNKASPKLSSSDSSKILPDFGSVSSPQVAGTESPSMSIAPSVQSQSQSSSTPQKPTTSSSNHNPMQNHGRPRQKSMKRDGGGNPQANGGFSHQASSSADGPHNFNQNSPRTNSGGGYDGSGRDGSQNHGHRDSGSRNASGDHPQPRSSNRRGGGGSHPRGDGYGGRRGDQDRGNHEWNQQRSFNGRDANMQPRGSPRNFGRPSPVGPVAPTFVHPAAIRPFMNHMAVAEVPMGFYVPSMPFVTPPAGPLFVHPVQDPLHSQIVGQIDYYFSNENLIKDTFLRQFMDEQGWVPISKIASFNKVKILTDNIQQILEALRSSTVVEVQGDKIRKRDDWMRWVMPPSIQFPTASGSQSPKSPTVATLLTQIQNVRVDEQTTDQNHPNLDVNAASVLRSSSGDVSNPLQTSKDGASSSGH